MNVLLISGDPAVRDTMAMTLRSIRRKLGEDEPVRFIEAADGVDGLAAAWRERPDVVVADEITSRAGAFAVARDLRQAAPPFAGPVIILLDRVQDAWLAQWSGADAWFVKPVNPFELAETVAAMVGEADREPA